MRIISSQLYLNWDIVAEKRKELDSQYQLRIPVLSLGAGRPALMNNYHHRYIAALIDNKKVIFDVQYCEEFQGKTVYDILKDKQNEGHYYWIDSGEYLTPHEMRKIVM